MLNHSSKGGSLIFELAVSLLLVTGMGVGSYILQHTPERDRVVMERLMTGE